MAVVLVNLIAQVKRYSGLLRSAPWLFWIKFYSKFCRKERKPGDILCKQFLYCLSMISSMQFNFLIFKLSTK